ncbi:uncharacterized protein ACNLHF_018326 [Anomaloglossus baeobatrachus]
MEVALIPKQLGIIKVAAHTKAQTPEARGNRLADQTAKQAALLPLKETETVSTTEEEMQNLFETQENASEEEKAGWLAKGAEKVEGIWRLNGLPVLPRSWFPAIFQVLHYPTHSSTNSIMNQMQPYWVAPGFRQYASQRIKACHICQQHNPGQLTKTPQRHMPKTFAPFQRVQIYEFVLVCVDLFSGWPEAYPVSSATARITAKKLACELVPRFGLPEVIESDRGTHFTGQVFQNTCALLGIQSALHTPYHPQSSGKVERLNGTLKLKLAKAVEETGRPWTECLPIALYSIRTTPQGKHRLSPFEILFGSAPRLGCYFPQELHLQCDSLTSYVVSLQKRLTETHQRVYSSLPDPDAVPGTHSLKPGDWVYLKKHVRKTLEPRFEGPLTVQLTTPTSVKLKGRSIWVHASHCKKA